MMQKRLRKLPRPRMVMIDLVVFLVNQNNLCLPYLTTVVVCSSLISKYYLEIGVEFAHTWINWRWLLETQTLKIHRT